jgi:uncharacterized membrane protein
MSLREPNRWAMGALSLVGAASMAATSLLQLGVVGDLPDPRWRWFGLRFNSKCVNLSDEAHVLGMRDGPIALLGFASTLAMTAAGGVDRPRRKPWIPIAVFAKAFGEAIGATVFFSKMPRKEKAWCIYCVTSAATSLGILALSIPEALSAARMLQRRSAYSRARRSGLTPAM